MGNISSIGSRGLGDLARVSSPSSGGGSSASSALSKAGGQDRDPVIAALSRG